MSYTKTYPLKLIIIALRRLPPPKVDIIKGAAGEQRQQQRGACNDKAHDGSFALGQRFCPLAPAQPDGSGYVR